MGENEFDEGIILERFHCWPGDFHSYASYHLPDVGFAQYTNAKPGKDAGYAGKRP
jgi:hypothetical protein